MVVMKAELTKQGWKIEKAKMLASLKIRKIKQKAEIKEQKAKNKARKNELKAARKIEEIRTKSARKIEKLKKRAESSRKPRLTKISIPSYSLSEELINSISHGVAAVFAIVALVLCVMKAQTPMAAASAAVYGAFLVILYVISCIYHALSSRVLGKKVMRVLDHINVMLMVAGTYTPICLSLLGGTLGWAIFGVVWAVTIVAVVFNAINVDKYQYVSVACNLILGWGALLLLPQLLAVCPLYAILVFLIGGGAVYSLGSILYVIGAKKKYMHSIFHFFVILASVLHFCFIYGYCL